jgi:hypothetical protein
MLFLQDESLDRRAKRGASDNEDRFEEIVIDLLFPNRLFQQRRSLHLSARALVRGTRAKRGLRTGSTLHVVRFVHLEGKKKNKNKRMMFLVFERPQHKPNTPPRRHPRHRQQKNTCLFYSTVLYANQSYSFSQHFPAKNPDPKMLSAKTLLHRLRSTFAEFAETPSYSVVHFHAIKQFVCFQNKTTKHKTVLVPEGRLVQCHPTHRDYATALHHLQTKKKKFARFPQQQPAQQQP